jgi:hypothetical protein
MTATYMFLLVVYVGPFDAAATYILTHIHLIRIEACLFNEFFILT